MRSLPFRDETSEERAERNKNEPYWPAAWIKECEEALDCELPVVLTPEPRDATMWSNLKTLAKHGRGGTPNEIHALAIWAESELRRLHERGS